MVFKIIHLLGEFLTSGRVSSAIHVYRHYTTSGGSNYINGQTKGGCYLRLWVKSGSAGCGSDNG